MVRLCAASGFLLLILSQTASAADHSPPVGFVPTPSHTTQRFARDVARAANVLLIPAYLPGEHRALEGADEPRLPRPRPAR